jgi:sugar lactone lactonase YvrE
LTCAAGFAQQPRIDSVSPSQGPIAGGTMITVKGAGLAGAAITLDRVAITPLSQSDFEVRLQTPKHDNGYVVIAAVSGAGTAYGRFLYVPPAFATLPPGFITTIAGVGPYKGEFGPATGATMFPVGLAFDPSGNLYVAEPDYDTVSRIRHDGIIERFAGRGSNKENCCGDGGPAIDAYISYVKNIAFDRQGNLYLPDHAYRMRRVDAASGVITTIAGDGHPGFTGDGGPAATARIGLPAHIAIDNAGNIYFTDMQANRIRRIDPSGTITTFAGNGTHGFSGDGGPATAASYAIHDSDTGALAVDAAGNLYLGDFDNNCIRRIDAATGIITTFAHWTNGATDPLNAGFGSITSLAFDAAGNLYYGGSTRIVELSPAGTFLKAWGSINAIAFSPDGTSLDDVRFLSADGLVFDAGGNLLVSEVMSGRIRRLNFSSGTIETVAGLSPDTIGENGPAVGAVLALQIADCVIAPSGDLLVAEERIRRMRPDGDIITVAGHSFKGAQPADGVPALTANVRALAVHPNLDGSFDTAAFAATINHVDANGINHIVVGFSDCGYSGDGKVAKTLVNSLCQPWDVARDGDGNLFIADTNNNRIRRVDAKTGILSTFAGNGSPVNGKENRGHGTYCGDGGPALDACFNTPYSIVFDADGNLFVSDWANNRIRRIDRNGVITTFVQVTNVFNLSFDRWGRLYANQSARVVRFDKSGAMTVVAGSGVAGFSGDGGPALQAKMETLQQSTGVAVDGEGNLFFVDNANRRIRGVRYGALIAPPNATVQVSANGGTVRAVVRDAGGQPAPGVRVDFTAPATGATCTLSSSFAITDPSGTANVSCMPNCAAGTYNVTAQPLMTSSTASVPFTNAGGPCRRRAVRR